MRLRTFKVAPSSKPRSKVKPLSTVGGGWGGGGRHLAGSVHRA